MRPTTANTIEEEQQSLLLLLSSPTAWQQPIWTLAHSALLRKLAKSAWQPGSCLPCSTAAFAKFASNDTRSLLNHLRRVSQSYSACRLRQHPTPKLLPLVDLFTSDFFNPLPSLHNSHTARLVTRHPHTIRTVKRFTYQSLELARAARAHPVVRYSISGAWRHRAGQKKDWELQVAMTGVPVATSLLAVESLIASGHPMVFHQETKFILSKKIGGWYKMFGVLDADIFRRHPQRLFKRVSGQRSTD